MAIKDVPFKISTRMPKKNMVPVGANAYRIAPAILLTVDIIPSTASSNFRYLEKKRSENKVPVYRNVSSYLRISQLKIITNKMRYKTASCINTVINFVPVEFVSGEQIYDVHFA